MQSFFCEIADQIKRVETNKLDFLEFGFLCDSNRFQINHLKKDFDFVENPSNA